LGDEQSGFIEGDSSKCSKVTGHDEGITPHP
jgi:hypothetical protein